MVSPFHRDLRASRPADRGFTLVEMLAVLGVILLLSALLAPAANSILRGSQLTQGAGMVADQLSFARQSALSLDCSVEVRFYQFADASVGENASQPGTGKYRAMQSFVISSATGNANPLGKMQTLPSGILIDSGQTLSSIIGLAKEPASPTDPASPKAILSAKQTAPLPGLGTRYNTVAFRYLPDGSANFTLAGTNWFLTVHGREAGDALTTAPKNFATYQINATNGHLDLYRP